MNALTTLKNRIHLHKDKIAFTLISLVLPIAARADDIPAIKSATDWMSNTLVGIAVTVLGLQIMYRLWQVNQGQKEWSEVAKPVLITAAIAATPAIGKVLMGLIK